MAEVGRRRSITGRRPRRVTVEEHELMVTLRRLGWGYERIGVALGRSTSTVAYSLNPPAAWARDQRASVYRLRTGPERLAGQALYYREHKEERVAYATAWRHRNPDYTRRYRERHPDRRRRLKRPIQWGQIFRSLYWIIFARQEQARRTSG